MSARNIYHEAVVKALEADGWTITHDPLRITFAAQDLYVDLGAERNTMAAEKGGQKIAVEIQSLLERSLGHEFHSAIGQYEVYRAVLGVNDPERVLYLAVPLRVQEDLLLERYGQFLIEQLKL